ncbi:MAG TPA: hypothetical protein VMS43_05810 [Allosphingosinicella sp.]|nr:hypothetical protein [Allosphingosinicella sp.]
MRWTWAAILSALMPAPAAAQTTPYTIYDETADGWAIARRTDGCFMHKIYGGPGATALTLFHSADGSSVPLTLMVSSPNWAVREGDTVAYRFELVGTTGQWSGPIRTLQDAERGVVSLNLAQPDARDLLDAFAHASRLDLYRDGRIAERLILPGGGGAIGRLRDCLTTFPRRDAAPIVAAGNPGASGVSHANA